MEQMTKEKTRSFDSLIHSLFSSFCQVVMQGIPLFFNNVTTWQMLHMIYHNSLQRNVSSFFSVFTLNNYLLFSAVAQCQSVMHTVFKEKGGDYRAMASSQGVLSEG